MKTQLIRILGCVGALLSFGMARAATSIPYLDWDAETKSLVNRTCSDYEVVTPETSKLEGGKWYVVNSTVSRAGISVNGAAHLILADGGDLTVQGDYKTAGLTVNSRTKLTIYGQAGDTGKLTAIGDRAAGIGGDYWTESGEIVINGGTIVAKAGWSSAGIGGGWGSGSGPITIHGGNISAYGSGGAAGIGGGFDGACESVTITGGYVLAKGAGGADIGGGVRQGGATEADRRDSGSLVITGGTVIAEDIQTPSPKVVYDIQSKTLTFAFDTIEYVPEEGVRRVWTDLTAHEWTVYSKPNAREATNVVIDASFAQYQPTSTEEWFYSLKDIKTLDLTSLDLSETTNMKYMFAHSTLLRRIYVSDRIKRVKCPLENSFGMFYDCENLVGGNGTRNYSGTISADNYGKYAQVDGEDFYGTGFTKGFYTRLPTPIPDYTVVVPALPEDIRSVVVYRNNEQVGTQSGFYTAKAGDVMKLVFTAAEGFLFEGGSETATLQTKPLTGGLTIDYSELPERKPIPPPRVARPVGVVSGTTLTLYFDAEDHSGTVYEGETWAKWRPEELRESNLLKIVIDPSFAAARLTTMKQLFFNLDHVTEIQGLEYLNTSSVTNMDYMFAGLRDLKALNVGETFVTSAVTSSRGMFDESWSLTGAFGSTLSDCGFQETDATYARADLGALRPGLFTPPTPNVAAIRGADETITPYTSFGAALAALASGETLVALADPGEEILRLHETGATLAFLTRPAGEVFISFDKPSDFAGSTIVSNAFELALDPAKVRICSPGYAAFADAEGNIVLEPTQARPFVLMTESSFTPYRTAAEALAAGADELTLGVLNYTNAVLATQADHFSGELTIPQNRSVTLTTAYRASPDGTNTVWSATGDSVSTLDGTITINGTNTLGRIRFEGRLVIGLKGVLKLASDFPVPERLYLTLADAAAMEGMAFVSSESLTAEELKSFCRVTNTGWTFEPTAEGLVVRKVDDEVAFVGSTPYASFEAALSAVGTEGTIDLLALTNTTTGAHRDLVSVAARELTIPENAKIALDSRLRVTTFNDYAFEDDPETPTTFDLQGVKLTLGEGATLDLENVSIEGCVNLSGAGLLVVTNYVGAPISVAFDPVQGQGVNRVFARGNKDSFVLAAQQGELRQDGDFVAWYVDYFAWNYRQDGNGIGYLDINDNGTWKRDIMVESQSGTFRYTYTRDVTGEKVDLVGYLLYVDYDKLIVRAPTDVTNEYLNENGQWTSFTDGASIAMDWKIDSDGCVSVVFDGNYDDVRKVRGVAFPAKDIDTIMFEMSQQFENTDDKDDGGLGAALAAVFGSAAGIGGAAGVYALLNAAAGGVGAAGVAGMGVGGLADFAAEAAAEAEAGGEAAEGGSKFEKFHKWLSRFFDAVTIAQMLKDIIQMAYCPIEYKGVPYFADKFNEINQDACDENDANYSIHWFFQDGVSGSTLSPGYADITAEYSYSEFIKDFGQLGDGSAFERFSKVLNWVMRIDAIYETGKTLHPSWIAIAGEFVSLVKNIARKSEERSYFDPETDQSVVIPEGSGYAVIAMEFGKKGGDPRGPRTAPLFIVKNGGTLKLVDCTFQNYTYNTTKGLVYVEKGGTLSLEDVKVNGWLSQDGVTPPIIAEEGATVWIAGSTEIPRLGGGATLSIGLGPYRGVGATEVTEFDGSVGVSGSVKVGGAFGEIVFPKSAEFYKKIYSVDYGNWVEPSIVGSKALWAIKQDVNPLEFIEPLSIEVYDDVAGRAAKLTGRLKTVVPFMNYVILGAENLTDTFEPEATGQINFSSDGSFTNYIPLKTKSRFFRVRVE